MAERSVPGVDGRSSTESRQSHPLNTFLLPGVSCPLRNKPLLKNDRGTNDDNGEKQVGGDSMASETQMQAENAKLEAERDYHREMGEIQNERSRMQQL